MIKELKLRAYRKDLKPDQKVMEYWGNLEEIKLLFTIYPEMDLEKFDIMQFTGLTDKNGVEVYEGDILEWEDIKCPKCGEGENLIAEVKFGVLGVCLYGQPIWNRTEKIKIIGNVYETPELLK